MRERCPEEEWLFRKEEVSAWSPFEQRADSTSAQTGKNMGNRLAERCLHRLFTRYRAFYSGREPNELGLLLTRIYSEGDVDCLKFKNILIGL